GVVVVVVPVEVVVVLDVVVVVVVLVVDVVVVGGTTRTRRVGGRHTGNAGSVDADYRARWVEGKVVRGSDRRAGSGPTGIVQLGYEGIFEFLVAKLREFLGQEPKVERQAGRASRHGKIDLQEGYMKGHVAPARYQAPAKLHSALG